MILLYQQQNGDLPSSLSDLGDVDERAFTDPWGRQFIYTSPGENGQPFTLKSYGRDGTVGGSGADADYQYERPNPP